MDPTLSSNWHGEEIDVWEFSSDAIIPDYGPSSQITGPFLVRSGSSQIFAESSLDWHQ